MKKKLLILSSLLMMVTGCNDVPPSPTEPSVTPPTSEVSTPTPSTPETPSVPTFDFPQISSFTTPQSYQSANPLKWGYQAKLDASMYYIYLYQRIPANVVDANEFSKDNTHVAVDIFTTSETKDIRLLVDCAGNHLLEAGENLIENVEVKVQETTSQIEYRIKVKSKSVISSLTTMKFYSYDDQTKVGYSVDDFIVTLDSYKYHTHVGKGWSVDAHSICFKNEEHYLTPTEYQHPVPERLKYHMLAADEGLYIYAENTVNSFINTGDQWADQTHIEFSLYNHCVGMGLQYGLGTDTYIAVWPDGRYFFNNQAGLKALDVTKCEVNGNKVTYRIFIKFDNNFDNPQDGPYSFVAVRAFDKSDNGLPYNDKDYVEYRDARFVHKNPGDSVWVHRNGIDHVDNPYETRYVEDRNKVWNEQGLANSKNLTLFIGDSYFESFNWWTTFYNDYANKAAFTTAIGGTRVTEWINWIDALMGPYDANLKNVVIHLGYNDIGQTLTPAADIVKFHKILLERIHEAYPNANIYTYGIGVSYWFETANNGMNYKQRVLEHDALLKQELENISYVKFLDVQPEYDKYVASGYSLQSFFKDGTHPTNANYKVFMDLLEQAGCVIADK